MRAVPRWVLATVLAVPLCAASSERETPASTYAARRAAAMARVGSDILIVPSRASFAEADQRGFVQAPYFQYLTELEELVGAALAIDGATAADTLFVAAPMVGSIDRTQFSTVLATSELTGAPAGSARLKTRLSTFRITGRRTRLCASPSR